MDFLARILQEKQKEVAVMPLEERLPVTRRPNLYSKMQKSTQQMQVIAEIKRASPSKGIINQEVDIINQAKTYEKAGAAAISVLTDPVFFKGNIQDLRLIAKTVSLPILCKDFIISEKQLLRAKNAGASIVLLIVAALTEKQLYHLFEKAVVLELEVLVEVHNLEELRRAEKLGAYLIGVNNRNLMTFDVSIETSALLSPQLSDRIYISESGFKSKTDVQQVTARYQGILVGETLMCSEDVAEKMKELQVSRCG